MAFVFRKAVLVVNRIHTKCQPELVTVPEDGDFVISYQF